MLRVLDSELSIVSVDGQMRVIDRSKRCHGYPNGCKCDVCRDRRSRTRFLETKYSLDVAAHLAMIDSLAA